MILLLDFPEIESGTLQSANPFYNEDLSQEKEEDEILDDEELVQEVESKYQSDFE